MKRFAWISVAALLLAPVPVFSQSTTSMGVAMPPAQVKGTLGARERHRNNLSRERARATSEHARRVRQGQ